MHLALKTGPIALLPKRKQRPTIDEDALSAAVHSEVDAMLHRLLDRAGNMSVIPGDAAIADTLRREVGEDFAAAWLAYVEELGL